VLIPLSIVFIQTSQLGWKKFAGVITNERVLHSYQVSFTTSFAAAIVNAIFGLLIAWVLVRYKFPGKRLLDGLIDLPFALTTLYAENGWIGKIFSLFHIKVAFTPLGIIVALTFIGLPFVVRMVQPVLQNIDKEVEEAASS
ncbi:sulfate ABC transporter permease, partial [Bacillus thuringiensis]|nr:sulfate ABC transporter permease [Bacillus thuringiensis]